MSRAQGSGHREGVSPVPSLALRPVPSAPYFFFSNEQAPTALVGSSAAWPESM